MGLKIQQALARFLRNRGWVVFYLEERNRECVDGFCWLKLYVWEESRGKK